MTRIALIPWVKGSRGCWAGNGYTVARLRWTIDQLLKAAPTLPIYVATPHVDATEALAPARIIDCGKFLARHKLIECGVMTCQFHPDLAHVDIDSITADTLVLRDPQDVMPSGDWWAPQQHLPQARPYGDWFCHVPANHPLRVACYETFTKRPDLQRKFDRYVLETARSKRLEPRLLRPPTIINGEWIAEGWKPWCQPLTEITAAVHPHSHTKWPEFASTHPYFAHLPAKFAEPTPKVAWSPLDIPNTLS